MRAGGIVVASPAPVVWRLITVDAGAGPGIAKALLLLASRAPSPATAHKPATRPRCPAKGADSSAASPRCGPAAPPSSGCAAGTADRARPAEATARPHDDADHLSLVAGQHLRGRCLGLVPRVAVQAEHPPRCDRVERQALHQRVRIQQPPVLDPRPRLEHPEILLDPPPHLKRSTIS